MSFADLSSFSGVSLLYARIDGGAVAPVLAATPRTYTVYAFTCYS